MTRRRRALRGASLAAVVCWACQPGVPPELRPDEVLRSELGLTDDDEVHRVRIVGAEAEEVAPSEVLLERPSWVEFVSTDWRVHTIRFDVGALSAERAAFLRETDQVASPPLVEVDARFVVSFHEAPPGRYPFIVEGNGRAGYGVVVVTRPER